LPTPVNPRNLLYSHQIIFTPLFWAFSYPELRLIRRKWPKKQSLHVVNEHFEDISNAVGEGKATFAYSSCVPVNDAAIFAFGNH